MSRTSLLRSSRRFMAGAALTFSISAQASGPLLPQPSMPTPPPRTDFAPDIVRGSNALAIDLWKQLDRRPGNLAISPASISAALAMIWYGAKGATAEQMWRVLHVDSDPEQAGRDWGRLLQALESPSRGTILRVADRLYAQKDAVFEPSFLDWSNQTFGAGLERLDFGRAAEASRAHINAWVDERTQHHIHDLLPAGAINSYTRMLLVNAIYFMGAWTDTFDEDATAPAAFFVAPAKHHDVPTMHLTARLTAAQVDGAKVLTLDYDQSYADMVFVLPDKVDGLADLEGNMTAGSVDAWMKVVEWKPKVIVSLPKFQIDPASSLDLGETLSALGMVDAFDSDRADFTGIAKLHEPKDHLHLADVVHKSNVTVDEKGAEAEAATVMVFSYPMSAPVRFGDPPPPPPPFVFKADHPFLFLIRDRSSGLILFIGHVTDPAAP